jgi:hypothetical protein
MSEIEGLNASSQTQDDNRSEYSITSDLSYTSHTSRSSTSSKKSGMSSVSILSNLSATSETSTTSKKSSFTIHGLDHTLLSRGSVPSKEQSSSEKRFGKKEKREQKRKVRGEGRDQWGIRREGQLCQDLWLLADITSVTRTVLDLSDVLLISLDSEGEAGMSEGESLARQLHQAMDRYAEIAQSHPPTIAPNYPMVWLKQRQLVYIAKYQDKVIDMNMNANRSAAAASMVNDENETWWKAAAMGIQLWRNNRKLSLI